MSQATFTTGTAAQHGNHALTRTAAQRLARRVEQFTTADRVRVLDGRGLHVRSVQHLTDETIIAFFDRPDAPQGFQLRISTDTDHPYAAFLQWQQTDVTEITPSDRDSHRPSRRDVADGETGVTYRLVASVADISHVEGRKRLYDASVSVNKDWLHQSFAEQDAWTAPEGDRVMVP